MNTIFSKLFIIFILFCNAVSLAEITSLNSALRNKPPYYSIKDGQVSGIDYELANIIFNKAGISLKYDTNHPVLWKEILSQIKTGKKDVIGDATDTLEREHWAFFTKAYRLDSHSIITKSANKSPFTDAVQFINFIEADKNLKFGIDRGYLYNSAEINKFIEQPGATSIVIKDSPQDLIEALNKNEADYIILNTLTASQLLPTSGHYSIIDIKAVAPVSFMLSKKTVTPEVIDKVNAAIDDSKKEIDAIITKYHAYGN